MKNLILTALFSVLLIGVPVSAQSRENRQGEHNKPSAAERPRQVRQRPRFIGPRIQENRRGFENQIYVRNEYRYVEYRHEVYKETYRTTYTRDGNVINRILIRRERVSERDRRKGFRFNIFIPFG